LENELERDLGKRDATESESVARHVGRSLQKNASVSERNTRMARVSANWVHPDGTGALKKTDRKPSASRAADGRLAATQSPASSTWRFFVQGRFRSLICPPEERVTRRRSQVGFARCSVCDRQSFARTTPSNRTTNRGSGEKPLQTGGTQLTGPFSLVRFVEGILRKARVSRLLREQRSRVSLQFRLSGGGRWIRTLSPVSSCWVRSYLSATYGDFIPGPSAAEKRIRLGYAIE
jgi:hypothetical protein